MKAITSTVAMGAALLCKMLVGLVAVKLGARLIGVENFGLTGQISSLIAMVTLLSSGGVAIGLAKIRSDDNIAPADMAHWIAAARILCAGAASLLLLGFLCAEDYIRAVVLDDSAYAGPVFFCLLLCVVPISLSGISQGLINGTQNSGLYAKSLLLGSVVGIAGFLGMSYGWGEGGALAGMVWLPAAQALAIMFLARGLAPATARREPLSSSYREVAYLGKFGLLSMTAGASIPLAYIFVRILVQKYLGTESLGLWQAALRLSEAYVQLPTLVLSVVLFARFASRAKAPPEWREVGRAYLLIAVLMVAIGLFVHAARIHLVDILFTKEFARVSGLFVWQACGDTLRMLSYVGTTILAARGFVKLCIFAELLQGLLFCACSLIILPGSGVLGPFVAYIVTYGIYLVFTVSALACSEIKKETSYAHPDR